MNITQLRDKLDELIRQGYGEHTAAISTPANDYWKTTLAPAVRTVEVGQVVFSEYHCTNKLIDDPDVESAREVIVLS